MALRLKHGEDGVAVVVNDDSELLPEARDLNYSGERAPLTMAERRAKLAGFNSILEREREQTFRNFLAFGREALDERSQAAGTDSAGGFLVPASFAQKFIVSLKQYDQIFDAATLVESDFGGIMTFPIDDDTGAVASLVAENAPSLTTAPAIFDKVSFGRCPLWRSGLIVAPLELAQDSAYDLASLLASSAARRFARGVGSQFITNLLADATTGVTSASPTAITGDEVLDLVASVDSAYAINGSYLASTATVTALRKLKASTAGSYLLDFDRDPVTGRKTLFDFPIYESPSMAAIGATNVPLAFGDLSRIIRRQVKNGLTVRVYLERYAEKGEIGYESFLRVDSKLSKATNAPVPVRLLACHS
jgi:HK97 family phage major capsid protein